MIVRRAGEADIDLVAPLFDRYRMFYGQHSDPDRARDFLRARIGRSESVVLIAMSAEAAAGFVQLYPSFSSVRAAPVMILNDLYVAEHFRRRGVASVLLASARDFARDAGAAHLSLTTGVRNAAAQSLYERAGWIRETEFLTFGLDVAIDRVAS